jgi:hypothetical protein
VIPCQSHTKKNSVQVFDAAVLSFPLALWWCGTKVWWDDDSHGGYGRTLGIALLAKHTQVRSHCHCVPLCAHGTLFDPLVVDGYQ